MDTQDISVQVAPEADGERLDIVISGQTGQTRSHIKKLVARGDVFLNGTVVKKAGVIVRSGDEIRIAAARETATKEVTKGEEHADIYAQIRILKEAPTYLLVHKPAGLLVHPTLARESVTLTSWLLKHYPDISGVGEHPIRPGIVHRLDKDASGVLVVARTQEMHAHLKAQFKARTIKKEYRVLVYGTIEKDTDTIDFAIDRGKEGRMVARPRPSKLSLKTIDDIQPGKEARTDFRVLERFGRFTYLAVKIHSGRTHQIRVHMYAYAHPVVGDTLYEQKKLVKKGDQPLDRLFLHAHILCFKDLAGEEICTEDPLPQELEDYLDVLR